MSEFIDFLFSTKFFLYAAMSLLPLLGWLYFFQKIHREKRSHVILTFVAGMLSVVPIKLYERYFNEGLWYFEHVNLFQYLGDLMHMPEITEFLAYIVMNAIVAFAIFLFTGLLMFLLEIFSGDNTIDIFKRKFRRILETPFFFVSIGVILGIVAYLFSSVSTEFNWFELSVTKKVSFFIVVGMLEEYIKHLVLRFSDEEKIRSVDDAVSYSIIIAFGFCFVENIMYFSNFANNYNNSLQSLLVFLVLRSIISVGAHVCFSAISGYFYGIATFANEIVREEVFRVRHSVLVKMQRVIHIKIATLFHEEKMMEGLLLAMLFHSVFNLLLQFSLIIVVVPFLLVLFIWVLSFFHKIRYHRDQNNLTEQDISQKGFEVLMIHKDSV